MAYTLQQLVSFAEGAGFQGDQAKTIAAIAYAESSGNPYAINYADPGGSYGLTQVNAAAHGAAAINTLGNPQEAFRQAFNISGGGSNFTPWSTFNNGAYLPFASQLGLTSGTTAGSLGGGALATSVAGSSPADSGGLSGQTATGTPTTSQSPLSAIFSSVANLFQSAGVLILGVVLVAIGAWYIAQPKTPKASA